MKSLLWFCIAFGVTLGVVVAIRLTPAGLLFVATLLLGVLLCPMLAILWKLSGSEEVAEVEVRIEKPQPSTRYRALSAGKKPRRGNWEPLQQSWFGTEESGQTVPNGR
jgi:hypothetical protein